MARCSVCAKPMLTEWPHHHPTLQDEAMTWEPPQYLKEWADRVWGPGNWIAHAGCSENLAPKKNTIHHKDWHNDDV